MDSHGFFLQLQGEQDQLVQALRRGDLSAAGLADKEQRLLELVETLTRHAYQTTAQSIERLREVGWTDEQIAEAVYITALFAFFNRVADAFGLLEANVVQELQSNTDAE